MSLPDFGMHCRAVACLRVSQFHDDLLAFIMKPYVMTSSRLGFITIVMASTVTKPAAMLFLRSFVKGPENSFEMTN